MFDIRTFNLGAGSYLRMTPEKALAKAEKENKDLYLQACLERRRTFIPVVYSTLSPIPTSSVFPCPSVSQLYTNSDTSLAIR